MKTVLAGLFALFAFFAFFNGETIYAHGACLQGQASQCSIVDPGPGCVPHGFCDPVTGTAHYCCGGSTTQPSAGTAQGAGQAGTTAGFNPFDGCPTNEVNTAIGCIPTDPSAFIGKFLSLGIGMAGGIAFLLILFGGFQIMTSTGNPEQLNEGRELVGSAVTGLLLIIFSLFLLRLIGYNILGIPGFG